MAALQYPRGRYRGILVSVVDPHLLMQNRHCEQPLHFAWCVLLHEGKYSLLCH